MLIKLLPSSLLVARKSRDKILPVYAESTGENVEIAKRLVELYSKHIGEKKGRLNQAVSELENMGYDYRFIRGLAFTLDRKCQLETKAKINPRETRRSLFQTSSEKGFPTTEEERKAILSAASAQLNTSVEELNEAIYGDLDDEMIVSSFEPLEPVDLLKEYNLSLTQTLLFNASELSFTASGNWQRIFRQIKWLGLIYTINMNDSSYWVKVDGPTSIFKLTKRYGTSLAKLLPAIFGSFHWRILAKVVDRMDRSRLLDFELDSLKFGRYFKEGIVEESFDSRVEENFAVQFKVLAKDWELIREPDPLPVGSHVMIPDFLMRKGLLQVYLEIVGFWTPEYLEDKMKKLSIVKDVDIIVAVDRRLACEKLPKKNERVNMFFYRGKVPLKPVISFLQDKEREFVDVEAKILQNRELNLTIPVADVKDIATIFKVSIETVKRIIDQFQPNGYRRIGDMFVKESLLNSIDETLTCKLKSQKLSFDEATKVIESMGGRNSSTILETLGYQIIWHGISPETAEIRKIKT